MSRELRSCRAGWRAVKEAAFGPGSDADRVREVRRAVGDNLDHAAGSQARWYDLIRHADPSGVSGTGRVAEVAEFEDGTTVLRWLSGTPSTVVYDSLEHAVMIHGHGGSTTLQPRR